MLRILKKSPAPQGDHEELFMERYSQMRRWSLHFADNDVDLAEDLLHDAFIHWTFTRPDLTAIQNLEGYLYEILRNLRLSQLRRATRNRLQQLSIFEYDQAEAGLRTIDPRERMQVQHELQHVCQYACARKDTSKGGSVLILRFFHGYYPSEIASILRSTRGSVDQRLRLTRAEIRTSLASPERLSFLHTNSPAKEIARDASASTGDQLLSEMRRAIFASCSGECFSPQQLSALYRSKVKTTLDCSTLAHIVSCVRCLDEVSRILGMPMLAERHAFDSLGLDRSKRGGPPAGGAGGGPTMEPVRPLRRRAKEVFEHRPSELHISVNGFILGSQKVTAELNELTLDVNLKEDVSFVEVFSEQETRLLFFKVEEPPPSGPVHQGVKISLSDDRTLELALQFRTPCPVLHAVYHDPLVQFEGAIEDSRNQLPTKSDTEAELATEISRTSSWLQQPLSRLGRTFDSTFWLRPGVVTAIVAIVLVVGAVLMFRSPTPAPLLASDLLRQATEMEDAVALKPDRVIHRTINLEERSQQGNLLSQRRLDVWRNGARKLDALRVYDEQNQLVGGEWTRDGLGRVLLHHGARLQPSPVRKISTVSITFDDVWQMAPSAETFAGLLEKTETAKVTETPTDYTITYQTDVTGTDGLQSATLVLSRPELRATKQVLLVKQGNEVREFTFIESSFEVRPASAVAPSVFEPEPELLSSAKLETGNSKLETGSSPSALSFSPGPMATADLEVEALRLLNQAGADQGEQVSVRRSQDGLLRITGVVETAARKSEIARALAPIVNDPAVRFEVQTVGEVIARQRNEKNSASRPMSIEGVEIQAETFPAYQELRARLSDAEARAFAARMISQSHSAMRRAGAMKRLLNQFSQEDLKSLSPDARAKWLALIRGHAQAFEQETRSLRRELQSIFFSSAPPGGNAGAQAIFGDEALAHAVRRLFDLGEANERVVSSAFATSSSGARATAIRSESFWQSLVAAEAIAESIQRVR